MQDTDYLQRFIFSGRSVRGEWVRLTDSWREILAHNDYPGVVQQQLGQALAAAALLAATVKFKGALIIQAQGDGPLRTLVAQATHDLCIRGLARYDDQVSGGKSQHIFGRGQLVLTIQREHAEPYQGVVELTGANLADALHSYFIRSEQLQTRLWLYADASQAMGMFLQELPATHGSGNDWKHLLALAQTITESELLDLTCDTLLTRLFHEEDIRLFDTQPVAFKCSCSSSKIENTLLSLGYAELQEILQTQHEINVDCEFCNRRYHFDKEAVARLIAATQATYQSSTRH
jgi:molecular chaperone Hsp33